MAFGDSLRDFGDNKAPGYLEAPACRVFSPNSQVSPGIFVFEDEDYDTDKMHDAGASSKITIQTAGKYHYGASIEWNNPGIPAAVTMEILLNGATVINKGVVSVLAVLANVAQEVVGDFEFAQGDFIEVKTDDTAGGMKGLAIASYSPVFWAHRIG